MSVPENSRPAHVEVVPRTVPATSDHDYEALLQFHRDVGIEVHRLKVRAEAQRQLAAAEACYAESPPVVSLGQFLAAEDDEASYLLDGLLPTGGRAILSAQYKAGKTTTVMNLIGSLVDGHAFLGQFDVMRRTKVILIDDELDPRMLRQWLRRQNIRSVENVGLVALRGRVSTFDITKAECRANWAAKIRGADVVILDCLRPILDALGLDENRDAGRFLVAFDALLKEAGASEALIVHHMGHVGERSRGDSRLQDWPDATWKLIRQKTDDPTSARYFSAFGRDVMVPETLLAYDSNSRTLSAVGGSREDTKASAIVNELVTKLSNAPGSSQNGIERLMPGYDVKSIRGAVRLAVEQGRVRKEPRHGKGGGYAYYPNPVNDTQGDTRSI